MIRLLVLLTCCSMTSCGGVVSMMYAAMTSSGKSPVCATDKPTTAISMDAGSKLRCAVECTRQPVCLVHQMNDDMKQCQLYDFIPSNYSSGTQECTAFNKLHDGRARPSVVPTCVGSKPKKMVAERPSSNCLQASSCNYTHSGLLVIITGSNFPSARGTAGSCSFPFTYDGQLYYTCAVNKSATPRHMWCSLSYNVPAICTGATYVYAANNKTINVTIQSSTVPLRSVNGWLTIMSRIDTSFPTGLSFSAYEAGFGNILSNFWLGLNLINQLTNPTVNGGRNYRLRLELLYASDNTWHSLEYDWFYLDGPTTTYKLRVARPGYGDTHDSVNTFSNGGVFTMTTSCALLRGPQWQTISNTCGCWYVFGVYKTTGFAFEEYHVARPSVYRQLEAFRMMVKN